MTSTMLLRSFGACALAALAISTSAPAQGTAVWPQGYANSRGEGAQAAPFTLSRAHPFQSARSVTTVAGTSAPFRAGSVVDGIAYRRDGIYNEVYPSATGTLTVRVGKIDDALRPRATYPLMWSTEPVVAFEGQINLPGSSRPSGGNAAPFNLSIPFQGPWTYTGGDFAIDLHYEGGAGSPWRRDAVQLPGQVDGLFATMGPGCEGSGGYTPYAWVETTRAVPGGSLVVRVDGAPLPPADGFAVALVGRLKDPFVPYSLDRVGFPSGCVLRVAPIEMWAVPTGARSRQFSQAMTQWPIPNDQNLIGKSVAAQWIVLDLAVRAITPATVSNGVAVTLGAAAPPAQAFGRTVWSYGTRGWSWFFESGHLSPLNYVAITQFSGAVVR